MSLNKLVKKWRKDAREVGQYNDPCDLWNKTLDKCADELEAALQQQGDAPTPVNGWVKAVDQELISTHLGVANADDSFDVAQKKLQELIAWHCDVATDPAVNGGFVLVPEKEVDKTVTLGDRVMVPVELSKEANKFLADFDMDSVGDNNSFGALECYHGLLDICSKRPPLLDFSNPIFHPGINLTVRRGSKWDSENHATIKIGDSTLIVPISTTTRKFYQLKDSMLREEHDPSCRTVDGLFAELSRVYQGFSRTEEVTLVRFHLPSFPQQSDDTHQTWYMI